MMDVLNSAINKGLKLGASQIEAYATNYLLREVCAEKGELKISSSYMFRGIGVRAIYNGGLGFAYTTDISEEAIERAVKQAISVAKARGKDPYFKTFPSANRLPSVKGIFFKETVETPLEEMVKRVKDLIEVAKDYDKRITSVSAEFSINFGERFVVNSLGVEFAEKYSSSTIYVFAVAEENEFMTSGYEFQSERNVRKLDFGKVSLTAAKMAIDLLRPKRIETGVMNILLRPIAVAELFGPTLIRSLQADNVQERRSFLVGKLGEEVATESLTVIDNALLEEGLRTRAFDAEGTPSRKIVVLDSGVLKTFLHNSYTSQREGVENTAHAARSPLSEPGIAPSNLIFEYRDSKELDRIIEETDRGVIANSVIGAHTANPVTGEFSVALSEAFYIEEGEIKYPIKQVMTGGNILDLLKKITNIGKDRRQIGSVVTGTIAFESVSVSG
ncbi:MAG: hypothetical protein DRJ51_03430 [Thermoprotei archaeon]|nr:MAG: hypothetical protein DRJ51_03430 [Thermoprotei archaeon]RLF02361.1 MAG: hypothetical protein DRJ59_03835 [Thermoprotei archaeon]